MQHDVLDGRDKAMFRTLTLKHANVSNPIYGYFQYLRVAVFFACLNKWPMVVGAVVVYPLMTFQLNIGHWAFIGPHSFLGIVFYLRFDCSSILSIPVGGPTCILPGGAMQAFSRNSRWPTPV